jgi:aryl-alcohol dehydrogenase-like predicted oxidoreductase
MNSEVSRRRLLKTIIASPILIGLPSISNALTTNYRKLGRTNLSVSAVGFGGLSIALARTDQTRISKLLNQALDSGLNILDTADCYGHQDALHSEAAIGEAVSHRREEFVLSSKVGHEKGSFGSDGDWSAESLSRTIDRSLKRLQTEYIDVVLLHGCSSKVLDRGEAVDALNRAQSAGKIRFLGYSGDGAPLRTAIASNDFDVVQLTLNVFDQYAIDDTLPLAREKDIGVMVKRPIGNAVWRYPDRPEFGYYHQYWDMLAKLKYAFFQPDRISARSSDSAGGIALRFVTSTPGVHTAIVGTTSIGRWSQNSRNVSAGYLGDAFYADIRKRWLDLPQQDRQPS